MVYSVALLHVSLPVLLFPLSISFHQCTHSSSSKCCCYKRDKMLERSEKQCFFVNGEALAVCSTGTQPSIGGVQYRNTAFNCRCAVPAHSLQLAVCSTATQPSMVYCSFVICTMFSFCSVCLFVEAVSPTELSRLEVLQ